MSQDVQAINKGVEPGDTHKARAKAKSLKKKGKSAKSKKPEVNSSRLDPEPDEAFSRAFLACRGTIPADVELGFR